MATRRATLAAADRVRIAQALAALGIAEGLVQRRGLPLYAEARTLAPAGLGSDGRDKMLSPRAARSWVALCQAAASEGIGLLLVSAFRSYAFQQALIAGKLARGQTLEEILKVNAPPGCSEHHTGRAVDIGVAGCPPLEEEFETTGAFRWLQANAGRFEWSLSYPRGNVHGYLYEPWHWCFQG